MHFALPCRVESILSSFHGQANAYLTDQLRDCIKVAASPLSLYKMSSTFAGRRLVTLAVATTTSYITLAARISHHQPPAHQCRAPLPIK